MKEVTTMSMTGMRVKEGQIRVKLNTLQDSVEHLIQVIQALRNKLEPCLRAELLLDVKNEELVKSNESLVPLAGEVESINNKVKFCINSLEVIIELCEL